MVCMGDTGISPPFLKRGNFDLFNTLINFDSTYLETSNFKGEKLKTRAPRS